MHRQHNGRHAPALYNEWQGFERNKLFEGISCYKSGVRENGTDFPQEEVLFDNSKHSVILGYVVYSTAVEPPLFIRQFTLLLTINIYQKWQKSS